MSERSPAVSPLIYDQLLAEFTEWVQHHDVSQTEFAEWVGRHATKAPADPSTNDQPATSSDDEPPAAPQ